MFLFQFSHVWVGRCNLLFFWSTSFCQSVKHDWASSNMQYRMTHLLPSISLYKTASNTVSKKVILSRSFVRSFVQYLMCSIRYGRVEWSNQAEQEMRRVWQHLCIRIWSSSRNLRTWSFYVVRFGLSRVIEMWDYGCWDSFHVTSSSYNIVTSSFMYDTVCLFVCTMEWNGMEWNEASIVLQSTMYVSTILNLHLVWSNSHEQFASTYFVQVVDVA